MKVKNIAFSGFAAMIFAGLCGVASAASVNLVTKSYVDDALETKANLIDLKELETTVGQKATQESLNKVATQVNQNTLDIAELQGKGYITNTDLGNAVSALEAVDVALQNAIDAIKDPDVDKAYVDNAISNLNTAISNLQGADSSMSQTIAGLETLVANAATKEEIKDFVASSVVESKIAEAVDGMLTAEDIKDFVSSGKLQEEIAKLATKDSIANFVNSEQVSVAINEATKDLATKAELENYVKSGDLATLIAAEVAKSNFATKTDLANAKSELQAAIDKINAGQVELTNYYTKAEAEAKFATKAEIPVIPTLVSAFINDAGYQTAADVQATVKDFAKTSDLDGFLTSADLSELETAVATLETANESMDAAIKVLQGGKVSTEDLNAKVAELTTADTNLRNAIDALEESMPSIDGLVNQTYVDGIKESLESADAALDAAIKAIESPDVDKAYVDNAISNLNTAISNLQGADSTMNQTIVALETLVANAATKEEIKDFITSSAVDSKIQDAVAGLATDEEIKDFVSSGKLQEEIAKLATKSEIENFMNSTQVSDAIANATKDLLTAADVAEFVKSGDMATAIANATKDLATKTDLANAKSELQAAIDKINGGDVELTNYYTKAEAEAKFATKAEIPVVPTVVSAFTNDAGYLNADSELNGAKITNGTVAKTALATDVQASLGLADTALQSHQSITTGTANGTIAVDGTDVAVAGLGSAAYTETSDYLVGPAPVMGTNFLQATCTNRKCNYSFISYDDVIDQIKSDAGIGGI